MFAALTGGGGEKKAGIYVLLKLKQLQYTHIASIGSSLPFPLS